MEGGRLMMDGGWWKIEDFSVSEGETSSPDDPHRLSSAERKKCHGKKQIISKTSLTYNPEKHSSLPSHSLQNCR